MLMLATKAAAFVMLWMVSTKARLPERASAAMIFAIILANRSKNGDVHALIGDLLVERRLGVEGGAEQACLRDVFWLGVTADHGTPLANQRHGLLRRSMRSLRVI